MKLDRKKLNKVQEKDILLANITICLRKDRELRHKYQLIQSLLRATIGSSAAAFLAGITPAINPHSADIRSDLIFKQIIIFKT
ncbi:MULTISPECIES: hypothetical protein [unclassified Microcoleus]|uniref:hypothetical protein n=1 Tax=unclassified Microcoleus TaxID=2642155 RepID=UPI0025E8C887|nr:MULTISPECIES: hypothetical protein [unclassified Microcoleus]